MIITMESSLAGEVPVSLDAVPAQPESIEGGWEAMPVPVDNAPEPIASSQPVEQRTAPGASSDVDGSDERAALEAELAQLDASWEHRKEPVVEVKADPALAALEARLSGLDL